MSPLNVTSSYPCQKTLWHTSKRSQLGRSDKLHSILRLGIGIISSIVQELTDEQNYVLEAQQLRQSSPFQNIQFFDSLQVSLKMSMGRVLSAINLYCALASPELTNYDKLLPPLVLHFGISYSTVLVHLPIYIFHSLSRFLD